MRKILSTVLLLLSSAILVHAQDHILLPERSSDRGMSVMQALQNRQTIREFSSEPLSAQDLSDLLWAASGVNRDNGKLTAPSAQNSQDVQLYVCREDGVFVYTPAEHSLTRVSSSNLLPALEGRRPSGAPLVLLLVSDMAKYSGYSPDGEHNEHFYEMGAVDSGIMSQNISIFCAGTGLATIVRAGMDHKTIREVLALSDTQFPWLNHPVGYIGR